MKQQPRSEVELGRPVVRWLETRGWRVYCEVQPRNYGPVADIVATRGPLIWVVELKTRFGLAVIDQAAAWIGRVHRVSIATPTTRNRSVVGCRLLESYGVGWITVLGADWASVVEPIYPRTCSRVQIESWRTCLAAIGRIALPVEAGTPSAAGRWTPFRQTCHRLTDYVRQHPGCRLKEAIEGISHHYASAASARGSLRDWIEKGRITSIELRVENRQTRLYPCESIDAASE